MPQTSARSSISKSSRPLKVKRPSAASSEKSNDPEVASGEKEVTSESTPDLCVRPGIRAEPGAELEARDEYGVWYKAKVIDVRFENRQVSCLHVHFFGWPARFDRWYTIDSEDLRPTAIKFAEGTVVLARWHFKLFPARIVSVNQDSTYDVIFLEDGVRKTLRSRSIQLPTEPLELIGNEAIGGRQMLSAVESSLVPAPSNSEPAFKWDGSSTTASNSKAAGMLCTSASLTNMAESGDTSASRKRLARSASMTPKVVNRLRHGEMNLAASAGAATSDMASKKKKKKNKKKKKSEKRPAEMKPTQLDRVSCATSISGITDESPQRASDRIKSKQIVPASTILKLMKKSASSSSTTLMLQSACNRTLSGLTATKSTLLGAATDVLLNADMAESRVSCATALESSLSAPMSAFQLPDNCLAVTPSSLMSSEPLTAKRTSLSLKKRSAQAVKATGKVKASPSAQLTTAALTPTLTEPSPVTEVSSIIPASTITTRRANARKSIAHALPVPPISKHKREGRIMTDSPCQSPFDDEKSQSLLPSKGVSEPDEAPSADSDSDLDDQPLAQCMNTTRSGSSTPALLDKDRTRASTASSRAPSRRSQLSAEERPLSAAPTVTTAPVNHSVASRSRRLRNSLPLQTDAILEDKSLDSFQKSDDASANADTQDEAVYEDTEQLATSSKDGSKVSATVTGNDLSKSKKRSRKRAQVVRDPRALPCPQGCGRRFLQANHMETHLKYGHHMQFQEARITVLNLHEAFNILAIQVRENPFVKQPAKRAETTAGSTTETAIASTAGHSTLETSSVVQASNSTAQVPENAFKQEIDALPLTTSVKVENDASVADANSTIGQTNSEKRAAQKRRRHNADKDAANGTSNSAVGHISSEKRSVQKRKRHDGEKRKSGARRRQSELDKSSTLPISGTGAPECEAAQEEAAAGLLQKRLANDDVVACICGQMKERGLMIQCDLCYSWQHSECYYGHTVTEDTIPLMHCCVACLFPYSVRNSQRFLHEEINFVRDASLPRLAPHLQLPERTNKSAEETNAMRLKRVTSQLAELEHIDRLLEFERCRIAQLRQARAGSLRLFNAAPQQSEASNEKNSDEINAEAPHGSPLTKRSRLSKEGETKNSTGEKESTLEPDLESESNVIDYLRSFEKLVEERLGALHDAVCDTERFLNSESECVPITMSADGCLLLPFGLTDTNSADTNEKTSDEMEVDLPSGSSNVSSSLPSLADLMADTIRSPPLSLVGTSPTAAAASHAKKPSADCSKTVISNEGLAKLSMRLRRELSKLMRL